MAKRLRIVPLLAMFVAAIFALSGCSGSSGDSITSGTIKGQVALQDGGDAGGIVVVAEQLTEGMTATAARVAGRAAAKVGDTFTAVTAEDGSFELTGLPLGEYSLYAERGDLIGQSTVNLNAEEVEAVLSLTPGAVISGSVIFKDLEGNNVTVPGAVAVIDGTSFTAEVSSGGSYSFTKVPRGSYAGITVMAEGFNDGHVGAFTVDSSSYSAPAVTVFSLEGAAVRRTVAGVVISAVDQQPIAGALVSLDGQYTVTTSENGTYFFPSVTAGEHVISVTAPGYGAGYTEIVVKPVERLNTWSVSFPDDIDSAADMIAELLSQDIELNYGDQGGDNTVSDSTISGDNTQSTSQDEDDSGSPATYADYINYLIATLPVDVTQAGTVNFLLTKSDGGIKGQVVVNQGGTTVPAAGATVKVYRAYDSSWDVTDDDALDNDQASGDFDDNGNNHDQDLENFDGAVEYANSSDIEDTSSLYYRRVLVAETTTDENGYYSVDVVGGLTYRVEVYYDTEADLFAGYHAHHEALAVHSGDTVTKNFVLVDDLKPYVVSVSAGDNMLMNEGTLWVGAEETGFDGSISITFNEAMNTSYALLADVELVVRDYNPGGIENTPNEGNYNYGEVEGNDYFGDVGDDANSLENARNGHVPAAFTWSADGKTLTITPAEALPAGYTFQVINLSNLEDLSGNNYDGQKCGLNTDGIADRLDDEDYDSFMTDVEQDQEATCSETDTDCCTWDYLGTATEDRFFGHPTLEFEVRSSQPEFLALAEDPTHVSCSSDSMDGDFTIEWSTVDGAVAYNVYATLGDPMMKVYIGTAGGEKFIGLEDTLRFEGSLSVINGALAADGQPTLSEIYASVDSLDGTGWGSKRILIGVTAVNKDGLEGNPRWVEVHDNIGPYVKAIDGDGEFVQLGSSAPYTLSQGTTIYGTNFKAWYPKGAYYLRTSVLKSGSYFVFQENLADGVGTITYVNGEKPMPEGYGGFEMTNDDDGELTVTRSLSDPKVVRYSFSDIYAVDTGDYLEVTYTDAFGNTTCAPVFLVDDIGPFVTAASKDTAAKTITVTLSEPIDSSTVTDADGNPNFDFTFSDGGAIDTDVAPTVSEDGKSVTFTYTGTIKGTVTVSAQSDLLDLSGNAATDEEATIADDRGPVIAWAAARLDDELDSVWIFFDENLEDDDPALTARNESTGALVELYQWQMATYTFTCGDQKRVVRWQDGCTDDCGELGITANGEIDDGEAVVVDENGESVGINLVAISYDDDWDGAAGDRDNGVKLTFDSNFFWDNTADCECTVSVDYVVDEAGNSNDPTEAHTVDVNDDLVGPVVSEVDLDDPEPGVEYNVAVITFDDAHSIVASTAETATYTFVIGGETYEAKWVDGGDGEYQSDESDLLADKPAVSGNTVTLKFKDEFFFAAVAPGDTLTVSGVMDAVGNLCSQLPFSLTDTLPPAITGITATEGDTYDTIVLQLSEALSATSQSYVQDPTKYTIEVDGVPVFVVGTPVYDADALTITLQIPNDVLTFTNGEVDQGIMVTITDSPNTFVLEDVRDNRAPGAVSTGDVVSPFVTGLAGDPAVVDEDGTTTTTDDYMQMGYTGEQMLTVTFNEDVVADSVFDPANWTVPDGWTIVDISNGDNAGTNVEGYTTQVVVRLSIPDPTTTGQQVVLAASAVVDMSGNAMAEDFVVEVGTTEYDDTAPYITSIALEDGDDLTDTIVLTVSEALKTDSDATDTTELEPGTFSIGGLPSGVEYITAIYDPAALTITVVLNEGANDLIREAVGDVYLTVNVAGNLMDDSPSENALASFYPFGNTGNFVDDDGDTDFYGETGSNESLVDPADPVGNIDTDPFNIDLRPFVAPRIIAHNFNTGLNGTLTDGTDRLVPVVIYFSKALNELTAEDAANYTLPTGYSLYAGPVYEESPAMSWAGTPGGVGSVPEEYKDSGSTSTLYRVTLWMRGTANITTSDELTVSEDIEDIFGNNLVDPTITANDKQAPIETALAITGLDLVDVGTQYDELTLTVNEALAGPLQAGDFLAWLITDDGDGVVEVTDNGDGTLAAGDDAVTQLTLLGDPVLSTDGTQVVLKVDDSVNDLTDLPVNQWVVVLPKDSGGHAGDNTDLTNGDVADASGNTMDATNEFDRGVMVQGSYVAAVTVASHTFDLGLGGGTAEGESTVDSFTVTFAPGSYSDDELETAFENPDNWAFTSSDADTIELFTNPQYDGTTDTVTVWVKITRGTGGDGEINGEDVCTITSSILDGGSATLTGGDNAGPQLLQPVTVTSSDDVAYTVTVYVSEDIDVEQLHPGDLSICVDTDTSTDATASGCGNADEYTVDVVGAPAYDDSTNLLTFKIGKYYAGTQYLNLGVTDNGKNEAVYVNWAAGEAIGIVDDTDETVASTANSGLGLDWMSVENDTTPPWISSVTGWYDGVGDTDGDENTAELFPVIITIKDDNPLNEQDTYGHWAVVQSVYDELIDWDNYQVVVANGTIGRYGKDASPVAEGAPLVPVHPSATADRTGASTEVEVTLWLVYKPAAAGDTVAAGDSITLEGTTSIVDAEGNTITMGDTLDGVDTAYAASGLTAHIDQPRVIDENVNDAVSGTDFSASTWSYQLVVDFNEQLYTAGDDTDSQDALYAANYSFSGENPVGYNSNTVGDDTDDIAPVQIADYTYSGSETGLASRVTLTFGSTGYGDAGANTKPALGDSLAVGTVGGPFDVDISITGGPRDGTQGHGTGTVDDDTNTWTFDTATLGTYNRAYPAAEFDLTTDGGVANDTFEIRFSNLPALGGTDVYHVWLFTDDGAGTTAFVDTGLTTASADATITDTAQDWDALMGTNLVQVFVTVDTDGDGDPSNDAVAFADPNAIDLTGGSAAQSISNRALRLSADNNATSGPAALAVGTADYAYGTPTVTASIAGGTSEWTLSGLATPPAGFEYRIWTDGAFVDAVTGDGDVTDATLTGASDLKVTLEPVAAPTTAPHTAIMNSW